MRTKALFVICLLSASAHPAAPQTDSSPNWKFSNVDEKLLDEVSELERQYEKKRLVMQDPDLNAYVEEVGNKLLKNRATPERVRFKFCVLRDPMVNAFAMPNGSIYVNTGLLAAMENEAQLAGVLAHEITHVTNRHTYQHNRSIRKKAVAIHVFTGVSAAAGVFPAGSVFGAALSLTGSISQVLLAASIFGYSQDLEREADRAGFDLLKRSSYDARAMSRSFEVLDERLEVEPVEVFWRTHPKLKERISTAKELSQGYDASGSSGCDEKIYLSRVAPAIRYNVAADLSSRRARTALARAQRLMRLDPKDPANQVLVADAWRGLGAKEPEPNEEELTRRGQSSHRQRLIKLTADEEQRELMKRPGGTDRRQTNLEKAKSLYLEVIAATPNYADAFRGLGMVYEDLSKDSEALQAYHRYLEVAGEAAPDRLRIERRVERLERRPIGGDGGAQK